MIDVQGAPNQEQIGILFNIVKRYGLLDKAMWQFYDFTQMSYLTSLYDETKHYANVAFNCGPSTVLSDIITGLTWYKYTSGHKINKAIIVLSRTRLTKAFVDECNEKEIDISAYFADSYQEVRELMSVGGHISYITTNGVDLPYYIARNFY